MRALLPAIVASGVLALTMLAADGGRSMTGLEAQGQPPIIQSDVPDSAVVPLSVKGTVLDRRRATIELAAPVEIGLMNADRRAWRRVTTMASDGSFGFTVRLTPGPYVVIAVSGGKKLAEAVVTAARQEVAGVIEVFLIVLPDGVLSCGLENLGSLAREQRLLPRSGAPGAVQTQPLAKPALVSAPVREYFYATDRARTTGRFSGPPAFNEEPAPKGALSFGSFSIGGSPAAPQYKEFDESLFYSKLKTEIDVSPEHALLIFVHGYLSTFPDAVETTARLDTALRFQGPVLLFSWPSQNRLSPRAYSAARLRADDAALNLRRVLDSVRKQVSPSRMHVIVHSLGGHVLNNLLLQVAPARVFEQVVFFAPDVNRTTLELQAQMQNLKSTATRITMYGSSHDCALQAAELVSDVPRAGRVSASSGILVAPPAESVDVSAAVAADDVLGHSYYGSSRVADDLVKVLAGATPAQRLLDASRTTPPYWVLRP